MYKSISSIITDVQSLIDLANARHSFALDSEINHTLRYIFDFTCNLDTEANNRMDLGLNRASEFLLLATDYNVISCELKILEIHLRQNGYSDIAERVNRSFKLYDLEYHANLDSYKQAKYLECLIFFNLI